MSGLERKYTVYIYILLLLVILPAGCGRETVNEKIGLQGHTAAVMGAVTQELNLLLQ